MSQFILAFEEVSYCYPSGAEPVLTDLTVRLAAGWTGVIGANGTGKTTLLRLAVGELVPTSGRISYGSRIAYCPQRTDDPPAELPALLESTEAHVCGLRGQLALDCDWARRWSTLSHGERKRAQLAVALAQQPDVLALDEPTNHIDMDAKRLLAGALRRFRGVGLLVSHDRDLLDELCAQCLLIEPPDVVLRPGGYSTAMALAKADAERARRDYDAARQELARLKRTAADRRRAAAAADHKRSKRSINPKDHDAKDRIERAKCTSKDGQAGRVLRQIQGRLDHARKQLAGLRARPARSPGLTMKGRTARQDSLASLRAGQLKLGGTRVLDFPDLTVTPTDRIALIGRNGAGKSTLLKYVVEHLKLPMERYLFIPQEIDAGRGEELLSAERRLPGPDLGRVMAVVGCLGSDPSRVLETERASPGEIRKVLLAQGVALAAELIIMDEPTNHLDLVSIECVENALAQSSAALLLVSHDCRFLRAVTRTAWQIDATGAVGVTTTERALP